MSISRREFCKIGTVAAAVVAGAGVLSTLGQTAQAAEEGRKKKDAGGGADQLCDPKAGMPKGMNYQHKHSDVKDAKLKTEKQGVKFDGQFCNNCSFYTQKTKIKGEDVGACQVLPGCVVASKGWCTSWNKKA
jgi:hypothetical protein